MKLGKINEAEIDVWPAFTDFMTSVLLIVVIFVFGIFFSNIARSLVRANSEFEEMQLRQKRVSEDLKHRLAGKVEIPPEDGNLQRIVLRVDEQGKGGVLFGLGSASLSEDGKEVLRHIISVLRDHRSEYDTIQVEGHTDDRPINGTYPSNWELSAARAGAVVNFILSEKGGSQQDQLEPWRFSANGRAEYRPSGVPELEMNLDSATNPRNGPPLEYVVKSNQTEGQDPRLDNPMEQRNRRIEIILTYKVSAASGGNKQR
jgi:flagellar motor protein MotB